ncbi:Protein of unknown function, partial [Gryllus bimaculatus]
LAESIIKIEEIKEEPVDKKEDCCWNSIVKEEPSALQHSIIDDDTDEELEPPEAVFVYPVEKQEETFIEGTKGIFGILVFVIKHSTDRFNPQRIERHQNNFRNNSNDLALNPQYLSNS